MYLKFKTSGTEITNQVSWLETDNILLNTLDRCIVILKGEPLSLCDCFLCAEVPTNRKKSPYLREASSICHNTSIFDFPEWNHVGRK